MNRTTKQEDEVRFGGVDWSWERHAVCVVAPDGRVVERFDVAHDADGLKQLARRLHRHHVPRVAIERGDGPVVVRWFCSPS